MNSIASTRRTNPLRDLQTFGQSVWLDYIRRNLITSGELQRLIDEDGLQGVTSNPAIFEKAIASSDDYTIAIGELARQGENDCKAIFEALAVLDIQAAANVLRPVYQRTHFRDGYVSLEVSPHLAHDTAGTVEEARRLWARVSRPNAMIKVPATFEGVNAIRELIGDGININATLLFGIEIYEQVAEAYLSGLETLARRGGDLTRLASVASFFISRIDSTVDAGLTSRILEGGSPADLATLAGLRGRVAIANARLAYSRYAAIYSSERWRALAAAGAQTQRLLWASTSTKNPAYRDVTYVEELIGPDTVNTIPPATFDAFRDHGQPRHALKENIDSARETMASLSRAGISMKQVTDRLLDEGVQLFVEAFESLLAAIERQRRTAVEPLTNRLAFVAPERLTADVNAAIDDWESRHKVRRLWAGDPSLWSGADEWRWLGWLRAVDDQQGNLRQLTDFSQWVKTQGFSHVLLLGMGGSSLCPDVLSRSFGRQPGFPEFHVLDSTDPTQIHAVERRIDLARTLFIVSSKSGSTLEPNIFNDYFLARAIDAGASADQSFVAVTDPGSSMEQAARRHGFRHVFPGIPDVGGRYSALTNFGLVPAAAMGLDVARFLDRTREMVRACAAGVPADQNPGVVLGALLGVSATRGRDKVTLICSPGVASLGAWLEQLLAESTGKQGRGLIPVAGEAPGTPDVYGRDRVFAYIHLASDESPALEQRIAALERAGQVVVRITLSDLYDLGQELFRWEMATAVAGSIIGINPFDQPDVEASKVATRELTSAFESTGELPREVPMLANGISVYADARYAATLRSSAGFEKSSEGYLRAHLARLDAGDYFALLAYLDMSEQNEALLQRIRHTVRDQMHVATCLGFGPRFLHSTGQAYKGGPNSGVFVQITCDDEADLAVPGRRYTFGVVKAAQARGDFQVLVERGRRALRIHLGGDVEHGLEKLADIVRTVRR
jgi:transaldolase/glucose-6-phosphate isomerase